MQIPEKPEYPTFTLDTPYGPFTVTVLDPAPTDEDVARNGKHAQPQAAFRLDAELVKINNIEVKVRGDYKVQHQGTDREYVYTSYGTIARVTGGYNNATQNQRDKVSKVALEAYKAITDEQRQLAHLARLRQDAEHAKHQADAAYREYLDKLEVAQSKHGRYTAYYLGLVEQNEE